MSSSFSIPAFEAEQQQKFPLFTILNIHPNKMCAYIESYTGKKRKVGEYTVQYIVIMTTQRKYYPFILCVKKVCQFFFKF